MDEYFTYWRSSAVDTRVYGNSYSTFDDLSEELGLLEINEYI